MQMFNQTYIQHELHTIQTHLKRPITLYILGGGAMSFYNLKTATKDIDVIVQTEQEAQTLIDALKKSRYTIMDITDGIYLQMKTRAIIENHDGFRWDIFVNTVCDGLTLSPSMIQRAQPFTQFKHMHIKLISPEDIFIFKAVTSRPRDREDMYTLFSHGLDIKAIKEEIIHQAQQDDNIAWISFFFVGLDELVQTYHIVFPQYDAFRKLAEQEMMERLLLTFIKEQPRTRSDLISLLKEDEKEIDRTLDTLVKKKVIQKKNKYYHRR